METELWQNPEPGQIRLEPGDLHIWRARLDGAGPEDALLWQELSVLEQERAGRFQLERHRQRFVRAHALTRIILSKYLAIPAARLEFQALPEGKPELADPGLRSLKFNLSHSSDLLAIALSRQFEVGVDVEVHSDALDWRQIARTYFDPQECSFLDSIGEPAAQLASFYRIWTMKEAYLKARGQGIAAGLRHTIVATDRELPVRFQALPGGEMEMRRWQAFFFKPATGASGTVVIERGETPFRISRYDGSRITPS